jgi:hypothetical protein
MLHRITPEPPRPVTVEDVAFRLASDAGKEPRGRLTSRRGWAPALAAASIVVIAGASAGLATAPTSDSSHNHAPGRGAGEVDVLARSGSTSRLRSFASA